MSANGSRAAPGGRRRLSHSADFDRVYRHGRAHANRYLVVYVFPRDDTDGGARLGLSVSRKVGGAVERNRVKRLLREAFRALAPAAGGLDVVIVARPPARELAEREGQGGITAALADVLPDAARAQEA